MNSRWRERVRALLLQHQGTLCADRRLYLGGQPSRQPGKHHIQSDVIVVDVDRAARDLAEGAHAKPQSILGPYFLLHRQPPRKIVPARPRVPISAAGWPPACPAGAGSRPRAIGTWN